MPDKIDRSDIDTIIESAGSIYGKETVQDAIKGQNIDNLLSKLSPGDAAKIKNLMSDKETMMKLLSSEKARMLLKHLTKGKN